LVELKSGIADADAAAQLNRYIKWLKAHIPDISVHQIIPTIIAPEVARDFHENLRIYLLGHGITQYRVVGIDDDLHLEQTIYTGL
jgi:RecB family endonuclease NucS